MENFLLYIANILLVALPLALFEILIEQDKGWGSGWDKTKWYAKTIFAESRVSRTLAHMFNIEPLLVYHAVVFLFLLPLVIILQYLFITQNILLLAACFLAVLTFEDFFWFLFNWNFNSLTQLLKGPKGSIWWHKGWTKIAPQTYIPTSYITGTGLSLILLFLA